MNAELDRDVGSDASTQRAGNKQFKAPFYDATIYFIHSKCVIFFFKCAHLYGITNLTRGDDLHLTLDLRLLARRLKKEWTSGLH